jgi:hypothetical protein
MQFEYSTTVLGATRMLVEGRPYAFVFVGAQAEPDREKDCHGFSIRKIPTEPAVFDQLADVKYGQPVNKTLIMILKQAAGGKSQPHVIGVSQQKLAPAAATTAGK